MKIHHIYSPQKEYEVCGESDTHYFVSDDRLLMYACDKALFIPVSRSEDDEET